ncbi:hypothetical protein PanWU01x14_181850, partial [Parasponia andersonii]
LIFIVPELHDDSEYPQFGFQFKSSRFSLNELSFLAIKANKLSLLSQMNFPMASVLTAKILRQRHQNVAILYWRVGESS